MASIDTTLAIWQCLAPILPYVKNEHKSKCKDPFSLCKTDFIPDKIKEVEEHLRNEIKHSVFNNSLENLKREMKVQEVPACILENEQYQREVTQHAQRIFEFKIAFFRSGKPLKSVCDALPPTEVTFLVIKRKDAPLEEVITPELLQKIPQKFQLAKKERKRNKAKNDLIIKAFYEDLNLIEAASAQHLLLKFYLKVCRSSGKSLDEITHEDVVGLKKELLSSINHYKAQRERKAEAAAEALMTEESLKKNLKKKKPMSQIASIPSSFGKQISLLNSSDFKSRYTLHTRVKRWRSELDKVKNFVDYDQSTKQLTRRYKKCSLSELTYMKQCHHLTGIEKFLSIEEFRSKYSFPYYYQPKDSQEKKEGLGIFAKMITSKGAQTGTIHIGSGKDNVLFHAMFHVIEESHFLPETLVKSLEGEDIKNEENDSSDSTQTYPTQFSILDDDVVEMRIENEDKESVLFHLYPI